MSAIAPVFDRRTDTAIGRSNLRCDRRRRHAHVSLALTKKGRHPFPEPGDAYVAYRTSAFDKLKPRVAYTCVLRHPMKCDGQRHFLNTVAFTGPNVKPEDASEFRTYRCSRRGRTGSS